MRTILLIIISFFVGDLKSQNITVVINKSMFKNAHRSIILVSDEEGNIHYELKINEKEQLNNYSVKIPIADPNSDWMITVFNEFKKINDGNIRYFFEANSYCNILHDTVLSLIDCNPYVLNCLSKKESTVKIYDVEYTDNVYFGLELDGYYQRSRTRKNRLKLQFDNTSDTYFLIHANGEELPSYLYIPYEELSRFMEFNWEDLSSISEIVRLNLPSNEIWTYSFHGLSEWTNRWTKLQSKNNENFEILELFVPDIDDFYEHLLQFSYINKNDTTTRKVKYTLSCNNISEANISPQFDIEYGLKLNDAQQLQLECSTPLKNLQFELEYHNTRYEGIGFGRYSMSSIVISNWIIQGNLKSNLNITLPDVPVSRKELKEDILLIKKTIPRKVTFRKADTYTSYKETQEIIDYLFLNHKVSVYETFSRK